MGISSCIYNSSANVFCSAAIISPAGTLSAVPASNLYPNSNFKSDFGNIFMLSSKK